VQHAGFLDRSLPTFVVQTECGALAALSDSGRYVASSIADGTGVATIRLPGELLGNSVSLTVTGFNRVPHVESLPVRSGSSGVDSTVGRAWIRNQPNPFGATTRIVFAVPASAAGSSVSVRIYDAAGRLVRTLTDGPREAGDHAVRWDGTDGSGRELPDGVYFARLTGRSLDASRKLVLLR